MNNITDNLSKCAGVALVTFSLSLMTSPPTQAASLDLSTGWGYSIGLASNGSGGPEFALSGIAIKQDEKTFYVAINAGADPAKGVYEAGVMNNNINHGDLFFNFTGQNFATANESQSLFAVRFAANDSGVSEMGVYSNVTAKSVTAINNGYNSLQQYLDYGWGATLTQGSDLPTPQQAKDYYGNNGLSPILNEINTGTKVGDISPLTADVLATLKFSQYGANSAYTFGFQFDKSLLSVGDFMANLWFECGNSALAISGTVDPASSTAVPEPLTIVGMALGSLSLLGLKLKYHS